jgi:hypothetical protein
MDIKKFGATVASRPTIETKVESAGTVNGINIPK